jgi:hypothetical protein
MDADSLSELSEHLWAIQVQYWRSRGLQWGVVSAVAWCIAISGVWFSVGTMVEKKWPEVRNSFNSLPFLLVSAFLGVFIPVLIY